MRCLLLWIGYRSLGCRGGSRYCCVRQGYCTAYGRSRGCSDVGGAQSTPCYRERYDHCQIVSSRTNVHYCLHVFIMLITTLLFVLNAQTGSLQNIQLLFDYRSSCYIHDSCLWLLQTESDVWISYSWWQAFNRVLSKCLRLLLQVILFQEWEMSQKWYVSS